jgi:uncharacterized protein (TIGR03790 family)
VLFSPGPRWRAVAAATVFAACTASVARATPGPDSVAVVGNANVPGSVALARAYATARDVPDAQVCLLDVPATVDVDFATYEARVLDALETCLGDALPRIEAVLLVRGMPLRVQLTVDGRAYSASLAATLGVYRSTMDGVPIAGQAPGMDAMCGTTPCLAARWTNPFRSGAFFPGWTRSTGRIEYRPLLVTMLHGRSDEDAMRLVTSALDAERPGWTPATIAFMDGADPARGALDAQYDEVIAALADRGVTDVERVPFDAERTGRTYGAFFTGTASLGATIEGAEFTPGALVDNLTSFGAVPVNFEPTGESQVSIARWVARGVGGVHGTTDEPLNNCFPSRYLIVDYVDGSTLAEAYLRRMPFTYWHNLVLGDPMLAPYARRPVVTIEGVTDGGRLDAARRVVVTATDPDARGAPTIVLYVDGVEVARPDGDRLEHCVAAAAGDDVQILAVAQAFDDGSDRGLHRPKGWASLRVASSGGATECTSGADAGTDADAGAAPDAGSGPAPDGGSPDRGADGGCGCASSSAPAGAAGPLVTLVVLFARRRRVPSCTHR